MTVYQSDPERAPDDSFEPGTLAHLVIGNRGRLLDARRTPFSVISLRERTGHVAIRLDAFEDEGAVWEIPFEGVSMLQFERMGAQAPKTVTRRLEAIADELDRTLEIGGNEVEVLATTRERLSAACEDASSWLEAESLFFESGSPALPDPATRHGDERLCRDLSAYCETWNMLEIERAFATQFVSNPWSGELVKGHRIVIAELGLVPYRGKIVRDETLFDGAWSKAARAEHILRRLAFLRTVFARLNRSTVRLYRGVSSRDSLRPVKNNTFLSATFSEEVARSHFTGDDEATVCALYRQEVPVRRVFMTYHETQAMNGPYREAEAVLLFDGDSAGF